MRRARFVVAPELFIAHTPARDFIGPGMCRLRNGELLMAAPWGRPPTDFAELAATAPTPVLYRSRDGGRSWRERGRMRMRWGLSGMVSDGGISFLRLRDGRIAFLAHRHVEGLHGGGVPVFSTSDDEGESWAPARLLHGVDDIYYVMNDRLVQLRSGRLVVPVSCGDKALGEGYTEGARSVARCFVSDDAGESWRLSAGSAALPDDVRGVAEPCVAETRDGSLLMLGRTGAGWNCMSRSADGGERWSAVVPTTQRAACAPLTLHALPDGRLIAFYDHADPLFPGAFFPRNPLVYSVSADGGESWGEPVAIDDEGVERVSGRHLQHIYPGACMTEEGIVLVYSTHYADAGGRFGGGGADAWRIGGGKRCILAFP